MKLNELPETVQRMVAFSGVRAPSTPGRVHLEQTGEMWRNPGGSPMAFSAKQWISEGDVGFSWRARFPMMPGVALHVEDAYKEGRGSLVGRVWGWLKIFDNSGPDFDLGEAVRYLAELPWAPGAYLGNEHLRWEEIPGGARVSCEIGDQRAQVDFEVDGEGMVVGARADRPREADGVVVPTPWTGRFGDWGKLGGVTIPLSGEVSWELPEGRFVYWRGEVTRYTSERPEPATMGA